MCLQQTLRERTLETCIEEHIILRVGNNLVKDENGDLLADSHNILNKWKNRISVTDVHKVSDVRKTEIYTAESLVPDPSPFEAETAAAKLVRYKLPSRD
jgi:hypothetical protein